MLYKRLLYQISRNWVYMIMTYIEMFIYGAV